MIECRPGLDQGIPHAFRTIQARALRLSNRAVMLPMIRSRAIDVNVPNALMSEYYAQRTAAGPIVRKGTSPSPNGLG
jgi:N-ethylmaleimide reductase